MFQFFASYRVTAFFLFLLIITCFSPLSAQVKNGLLIVKDKNKTYSLNGDWKFCYGDDIAWAKSKFDDSNWRTILFPSSVPAANDKKIAGFFWYRLHFSITNPELHDKTFFLSITRISHAYELYINGKKIGARGRLPGKDGSWQWGVGGHHGIVEPGMLHYGADNVIAIRVYGGYRFLSGALLDYSYLGPYDFKSNIYLLLIFLNNVVSSVVIVFGLFLLFTYMHKRDYYPKLWLSLMALFFGIMNIFQWLPDRINAQDTYSLYLLMLIFAGGANLSFMAFLYYFLADNWARLRKALLVIMGSYMVLLVIGQFSRGISPFHFIYFLSILVSNILLSILLYVAIMERRQKKKSGFYIILSVALVVLASIASGLVHYCKITIPPSSIFYNPYISFLFIFFMYLAIERGIVYNELKAARRFPPKSQKGKILKNVQQDELHKQLLKLMEDEELYKDDQLTLTQLASALSINHQKLSAFLNDRYAMNFNTYINTYRINEAKELLTENGDKSITEIAFEVGFNSLSRFYDAFKKITGETPKSYRKDNQ